jgi:hypothetical protein
MAFRLKRDVVVAADSERGLTPNAMVILEAGTDLEDISDYERRQLAPEHFEGVEADDGALPDDWRDNDRTTREDAQRAFLDEYIETHVTARED